MGQALSNASTSAAAAFLHDAHRRFSQRHYSPERYRQLLAAIHVAAGETCLRMCETPVFIPRAFAAGVQQGAVEIVAQCLDPGLRPELDRAVPLEFSMPSAPARPVFFIVDFALAREAEGRVVPRLIELQAFASNLFFIPAAAALYRETYQLGDECSYWLSANAAQSRRAAILNGHPPENVVLMEINPWAQPQRRDFVVTQKELGIAVVDVTAVIKKGRCLFYRDAQGREVPIRRLYNRVVPEEFERLGLRGKTAFNFDEPLEVEWAGDPGWFLRLSKYAMTLLRHPWVPETRLLGQVADYPADLENYVLKPAFASAGRGVKLEIARRDLDAIPAAARGRYVLMRKVDFAPVIPAPGGGWRHAELRVMLVWPDGGALTPVVMSARVMRGIDSNADLFGRTPWCGFAPVFAADD